MTRPSHIFIVGLPRSGTSLLRHILNLSPDVAIASESHFFGAPDTRGFLRRALARGDTRFYNQARRGIRHHVAQLGDLHSDDVVAQAVAYLYTRDRQYWLWLRENIPQEDVLQRALAAPRTEAGLFDALLGPFADDRPIRGEKTPQHLFYVPTLLDWYPRARVIHILRDPRAVYVSTLRKAEFQARRQARGAWRSWHTTQLAYTLISWLRAAHLHTLYAQRYTNQYRLCRFEDMVDAAEQTLPALCDFLEIDFLPAMLQPAFQNSSFTEPATKQGFDATSTERWRQHVHPLANQIVVASARRRLLEFGYPL